MRLVLKLVSVMVVITVAVLLLAEAYTIRSELRLIEADISRETLEVAQAVALSIAVAATETPQAVAQKMDRELQSVDVRWVADMPLGDAQTGPSVQLTVDQTGAKVVAARTGVHRGDGQGGTVIVQRRLEPARAFMRRQITKNLVGLSLILLISGVASFAMGHRLVGLPVEGLVQHAARIGAGDFAQHPAPSGGDELTLLARALNAMVRDLDRLTQRAADASAQALEAEANLRHADRLTTVGQLAAGIAHELGTPLNVISGRARMIERRSADAKNQRDAQIISEQSHRITRIVRHMLDFARKSTPSFRRADLNQIIDRSAGLLASTARQAGVTIEVSHPDQALMGMFDANLLEQVVTNLMVNAIQAHTEGGQVHVSASCLDQEDGRLRVSVRDTAGGIPDAIIARIFDPFFTTKEPSMGTGLGLSIVHGIVRQHGGEIDVASTVGLGTIVTVYLPAGGPSGPTDGPEEHRA